MKISVAQTRPVKGDIQTNIDNHKKLINLAANSGAEMIIFPELSITGYEPHLAKELAIDPNDKSLDDFQTISDENKMTIGVGMPTKNDEGICISMIIFHPLKSRQVYLKKYLHPDEEKFFVNGKNSTSFINNTHIALAICHEISIPQHAEDAINNDANIYIASVAKTSTGVEKASHTLSEIARKYSMTVLFSNAVGPSDDFISAGKTSAWDHRGKLIAQLNDTDEGILIIDTETEKLIEL